MLPLSQSNCRFVEAAMFQHENAVSVPIRAEKRGDVGFETAPAGARGSAIKSYVRQRGRSPDFNNGAKDSR
jgi:hypothetical protein